MTFAYLRVSTTDQNPERQQASIADYAQAVGVVIDRTYTDYASGKNFDRPQYQALKGTLRDGDVLIVKEIDRLGRNMNQIKAEWQTLQQLGITMIVVDSPILSTANKSDLERSLISNIVFELLAYMSEKERQKLRIRQAEGIAIAKAQGKFTGRKPLSCPDFMQVYHAWNGGSLTAVQAAERLDISVSTFYRRVQQLK